MFVWGWREGGGGALATETFLFKTSWKNSESSLQTIKKKQLDTKTSPHIRIIDTYSLNTLKIP